MCVRNLCEGNVENQEVCVVWLIILWCFKICLCMCILYKFVSSLQMQGVLQDELLEAQGIEVDVDSSSGKFSFRQTQKKE